MSLSQFTKHITADFINGAYAGIMRFNPREVPSDLKDAKAKANYRAGYLLGYGGAMVVKIVVAVIAAQFGVDLSIAATA